MTSDHFVPPAQWYATLPSVHVAAGVLITDEHDRLLLVKPNYRPHWSFPGGVAEDGEPPHECAAREAAEEVGLVVDVGPLLVVDWAPPEGERKRPMMNFLFEGGTADFADVVLQESELDDAAFVGWDDAVTRFPARTAPRIPAARRARRDQRPVYLPLS